MSTTQDQATRATRLTSRETLDLVRTYVRGRVGKQDQADVVQSVFEAALAAEQVPDDDVELRKWLVGIARHKTIDLFRRQGREQPTEFLELAGHATDSPLDPVEDRDLMRWAEETAREVSPDGDRTLGWIAREGGGEKLEHIAAEERLPAPTVRKRVSRLRAAIRERWVLELAGAAVVLGMLMLIAVKFLFWREQVPEAEREIPTEIRPPDAPPLERAMELRRVAIESCEREPARCLGLLDEAKKLDPAGDQHELIREARRRAREQLKPAPTASSRASARSTAFEAPSTAWPTATALPAPPQSAAPPRDSGPQEKGK